MIIVLVFIFIIMLFVPIGVRIIYDDNFSDVDVYIFKLIKYKFDLDSFVRKFIMDENDNTKISLITILNNLELTFNSKSLLRDIVKTIKIEKSTIVLKQDFENYLLFISYWNLIYRYIYIIRKSFKKINNEYYMINHGKQQISVEIIFKLKLINVLFMSLKNIKQLIKVMKIRRRQKHGTSNL